MSFAFHEKGKYRSDDKKLCKSMEYVSLDAALPLAQHRTTGLAHSQFRPRPIWYS